MKKLVITAVLLLSMVLMLVGCNQPEEKPSATPVPSVGPSQPTTLNAINAGEVYRYYVWSTDDENDPFRDAGARNQSLTEKWHAYEAEKSITIQYVKATGGHNWFDLPRSSAASGEPICDIFNVGGPYVVLGTAFYNGSLDSCLLPISDYSDYGKFDDAEYWDLQSQEICTFSDKLYCVVPQPYGADYIANHTVTLFNNEILEDAGYSIDELYTASKNGEWTWDEFKEAAIKCSSPDKGIYGTSLGDNIALGSALIVTNGGHYFQKKDGVDVFVGNQTNAIDAWTFIADLANQNAVLTDFSTEANSFGQGKVGMLVTTISRLGAIYQYLKFEYGIINPPKGPDAQDYISEVNWFVPISVMKGANNPAGCVQILSEYFRPEYGMSSVENTQLIDAELRAYLLDQGSLDTAMNITKYTSVENYFLYQTVTDGTTQMLQYLYGNVGKFISGEEAPQAFYDGVKPAIDKMVLDAMAKS